MLLNVIRHISRFGIEFPPNKDIGIFSHFMTIYFITQFNYHILISSIPTSWYSRLELGLLSVMVNDTFVVYSVFTGLFTLKLCILFEEQILFTPVQKYDVPPMVILYCNRWKPWGCSTKIVMCMELSMVADLCHFVFSLFRGDITKAP